MYTAYFGLREKPFTIAPDPRYLYMSHQHEEALAHLLYGMKCDGGFVLLTGEVGTGKTTVCRCLLSQVPDQADIAVIFNPKLTVLELLETVCDELLIPHPPQASIKVLVDRLNERLLETYAAGRRTILIIDEAQSLSAEVLEQLRLLTNLETDNHKLLQIILLGQPELRTILSRPEMRQLAQRITARFHLGALSCEEVNVYVRHRLEVAGCDRPIFPPAAIRRICRYSRGIPRLVNLICDRALLGAFTHNLGVVNRSIVRQAAREVLFEAEPPPRRPLQIAGLAALLLLAGLAISLGNAQFGWLQGFKPEAHEPLAKEQSASTEVAPAPQSALASAPVTVPMPAPLPKVWPSEFAVARSSTEAFADLAALWGMDVPKGTRDLCNFAKSAGLHCLSRQDSLVALRTLNRPAILTLYDNNGKPFQVLLAELDGRRARFVAGAQSQELDVDVLESLWFGEFLLLWKPPDAYTVPVVPGGGGPAVPWLAHSLETLGQYDRNGGEERLEGHLLGALKRYQLAAGLTPDGLLGPQTLIHLLNSLGSDGPRLMMVEEDN